MYNKYMQQVPSFKTHSEIKHFPQVFYGKRSNILTLIFGVNFTLESTR